MKTIVRTSVLFACLALALASCSNPFAGERANILLVLRSPAPRQILPAQTDLDAAISLYSIRLSRTGYPDLVKTTATSTVTIEDLVPGIWSISVAAFDGAGNQVAAGSSSINALAGSAVTSASIQLSWDRLHGTGSIEITIKFPKTEGIADVEAILAGSFTKTIPVTVESVDLTYDRVVVYDPAIPAGTPLLTVKFYSAGMDLPKAIMQEAVWVYRNLPTRASRILATTDFGAAPSAPAHVLVSSTGDGSMTVSWTATSLVADDYIVERSGSAEGPWTRLDDPEAPDPTERSYADTAVLASASWHYRVAAGNRFGQSGWATGVPALTPRLAVLGAKTALAAGSLVIDPAYWVNEISNPLTLYTYYIDFQTDIAHLGDDIIVSGSADVILNETAYPVFWRNGTPFTLGIASTLTAGAALAVLADGSDLYFAGVSGGDVVNLNNVLPVYWENGVGRYLDTDGWSWGVAASIFKDGTDIYIAGGLYDGVAARNPVYWLNGELVYLGYGVADSGKATGIATANGDVYAIGSVVYSGIEQGAYWVNGLLQLPDLGSAQYCAIRDISVSDGDVYMAGSVWTTANPVPAYWKNGALTILDRADFHTGVATGIAHAQGVLYLSGTLTPPSESDPDPDGYAVLWADGVVRFLDGIAADALAPITGYELSSGSDGTQQLLIEVQDRTQVDFSDAPILVLDSEGLSLETTFIGDSYDWYLDGTLELSGPAAAISFDPQYLPLGRRRVTVYVTKGGIEYSGTIDFEVVYSGVF